MRSLKINNYFLFVVILTCVGTQIAIEATDGTRIINEEDIEMRSEMVSSSCTDENVCLDMSNNLVLHTRSTGSC